MVFGARLFIQLRGPLGGNLAQGDGQFRKRGWVSAILVSGSSAVFFSSGELSSQLSIVIALGQSAAGNSVRIAR